ncbi:MULTISPECIES: hypothetical protein [Streptomyces]|uniref:hypothetical protein n=1 Tax=Streptomyces TaxID=1883 RepID=UPI0004CC05F7|nr:MULTISPECIES: hypothetical protein [Streptomyces]KOX31822.1 hypothetical protein ADL07_15100 [Streptomyces sp. NRRL F-4707]MCL7364809.1 hypothetical protein [Streptomyces ardesiacus]
MNPTDDTNVTPLPQRVQQPHWIRKLNIPVPVLPAHVRQRLRTPGFWTAMTAIAVFTAAYRYGQLPRSRDVVVALVLTGFVVLLGAVGMVCQTLKDIRGGSAAHRQASDAARDTTVSRRPAA